MKMWDEIADPDAPEVHMRRNTEEWLRSQLPPPEYGWTPGGLKIKLMEMTIELQRQKRPRIEWYQSKLAFVNELLRVLEGEGLVRCTYRRDTKKGKWVQNAFPPD